MSRERERYEEIIGKKIKVIEGDELSSQMGLGRKQVPAGPTTASGGTLNTVTPCAACKLLRRRCAQECPFCPYFSPLEPHRFASVHKVFGASNVSKMLMEVPESLRGDTANSLVYEANLRLRDPVYGCMGIILSLQQQVQALQAELCEVRAQIMRFKTSEDQSANNNNNIFIPSIHHHHHRVSFFVTAAPPPPPPAVMVLPRSSSASDNADFGTISSDNISYFDRLFDFLSYRQINDSVPQLLQ